MIDFTALNAELARDTDLTSALNTAIDKLLAAIEANKTDPAEVQAIVDAYRANNDATNAAIIKGTIADPTTP